MRRIDRIFGSIFPNSPELARRSHLGPPRPAASRDRLPKAKGSRRRGTSRGIQALQRGKHLEERLVEGLPVPERPGSPFDVSLLPIMNTESVLTGVGAKCHPQGRHNQSTRCLWNPGFPHSPTVKMVDRRRFDEMHRENDSIAANHPAMSNRFGTPRSCHHPG